MARMSAQATTAGAYLLDGRLDGLDDLEASDGAVLGRRHLLAAGIEASHVVQQLTQQHTQHSCGAAEAALSVMTKADLVAYRVHHPVAVGGVNEHGAHPAGAF